MVYVNIFMFMSVFSIYNALKNKNNKIVFIFLSSILVFISIFRFGSGTDYFAYNYHYEFNPTNIKESIESELDMEIGYKILMGMFKKLNLNFEFFIFIVSFIMILLFIITIYKNSKLKLLSLIIFFSVYYNIYINSAIRQGIAMGIIFFAYYHFFEKSKKKFCLLVLLSSFFHLSSLISLVIIPLEPLTKKFFNNIKVNIILTFISILGYLLGFSNLFITIMSYIGINIIYQPSSIPVLTIILRVCFLLFVFLLYKNTKNKDLEDLEKNQIYLYFLGTLFFFTISDVQVFSRLLEFFTMYEIIFIPNLISKIRKSSDKIIYSFLIILISGTILLKDLNSFTIQQDYYNQGPLEYKYTTIFNKEKLGTYRYKNRLQVLVEHLY